MSFSAGFQLSAELTKIFPIKQLVYATGEMILQYARELRRSGSDIVVEEDLADIFGRGLIVPVLEDEFRRAVLKNVTITPLNTISNISLQAGPGPTVTRALKDRRYLSTVIQLSFLGWGHDRMTLASDLADCMLKRADLGVPGAFPESGSEAIAGTLGACCSQASFAWDIFYRQIEDRIREVLPHLTMDQCQSLVLLPKDMLLGAMDYLYIVQRLPQNRKMMVSSEQGVATLIIWAHYILGLTVLLKLVPLRKDLRFGNEESPEVIITWTPAQKDKPYTVIKRKPVPFNIYLLADDLDIVLSTPPDDTIRIKSISDERHVLEGYGADYLRRYLNTKVSTADADPVCSTIINLLIACSISVSQRLRRQSTYESSQPYSMLGYKLERWRVIQAAEIIFQSFCLDQVQIDHYLAQLNPQTLKGFDLPRCLELYLHRSQEDIEDLRDAIMNLATLVLIFAHVVEVQHCSQMPLAFNLASIVQGSDLYNFLTIAESSVREDSLFDDLAQFLIGRTRKRQQSDGLVLVSDFGWSIYLDSIGDLDPADIRPELVHIKKGVPTSNRTQERKSQIRCPPDTCSSPPDHEHTAVTIRPIDQGKNYIPRCLTRVTRRVEYITTGRDEFLLTVLLDVSIASDNVPFTTKIEYYINYRQIYESLWTMPRTKACKHKKDVNVGEKKLGPDALTVIGFTRPVTNDFPHRIWIHLVKRDPGARAFTVVAGSGREDRSKMLRTEDCCEDCALDAVSIRPGNWSLIL